MAQHLSGKRIKCEKMGWDFDLDLDFVKNLYESPCYYCGSTESIQCDRKNNSRGYTKDNSAPACKRCNTIKGYLLSEYEMLTVATALGWRESSPLPRQLVSWVPSLP